MSKKISGGLCYARCGIGPPGFLEGRCLEKICEKNGTLPP